MAPTIIPILAIRWLYLYCFTVSTQVTFGYVKGNSNYINLRFSSSLFSIGLSLLAKHCQFFNIIWESSIKKTKLGTFLSCKRTLCDKSCLMFFCIWLHSQYLNCFSWGTLKWTVATDKSVVTLTLDTEIIKLDTPFFSLHLADVNQIFWITPPIFSVYLFPWCKILLLNIKQTILKTTYLSQLFFKAFSCCTLYLSCQTKAVSIRAKNAFT
jgi:hypothetical protein